MKRLLIAAAALLLAGCEAEVFGTRVEVGPDSASQVLAPSDLPTFFDCLRTSGQTIVSAHRGGPERGYAENAIGTLQHTVDTAPAFLEVDVGRSRDGVLVLMHDDTVDRTTEGIGRVDDLTLAELQSLRLEDTFGPINETGVPALRDALGWADGNAVLELDVKRDVSYEEVVRDVRGAGAMGRVVFITYSVDGASRLARLAPEAMIYTTIASVRDLDTLERRGVDLSHIVAWLGDEELDTGLVSALAERGVEARFGVFGRDDRFAEMAQAGVQSLAVDDVAAAYQAADTADGAEGYAALQCATAQ